MRGTVSASGLDSKVSLVQRAVGSEDGRRLFMRPESSPAARAIAEASGTALLEVETVSLSTILAGVDGPVIDTVKIDCEGGEYDIVLNSPLSVWERVQDVRLEFHDGREAELCERMRAAGLLLQHAERATVYGRQMGTLVFQRARIG